MSDTLRVSNLHFGLNTSNYNQPQMGFTSVGIGSTANYGFLQFYGTSNTLCWTANGTVGIGTTSPQYSLDVIGTTQLRGIIFGQPDVNPLPSSAYTTLAQQWTVVSGLSASANWYGCEVSATGQYQTALINGANGGNNIYYSSNYGATWSLATGFLANAAYIWMGMSGSGQYQLTSINSASSALYVSSNYGQTWSATSYTIGAGAAGRSSCISYDGQYQFNVQSGGSIAVSSNYGASFANAAVSTGGWNGVCCSSSGQYVTACIYGGNIFYSTNYGVAWTACTGLSNANWSQMCCSASGQYQMVTVGSGSIWYSSNYGVNWTVSNAPTAGWQSISCTSSGQYVIAPIPSGKFYYSTNYGVTWAILSSSPSVAWQACAISQNGVYSLACVNGGAVYSSLLANIAMVTNGMVGIGTTTINYPLQIGSTGSIIRIGGLRNEGSAANTTTFGLERSRNQIQFSGYRDALTDKVGAKIVAINKQTYGSATLRHLIQSTDLAFFTVAPDTNDLDNTVERMRITDTGNIGIGTNAPGSLLQVSGETAVNTLKMNAGGTAFQIARGKIAGGSSSGSVAFPFTFANIPSVCCTFETSSTTQLFSAGVSGVTTAGFNYVKTWNQTNGGTGGAATSEPVFWIAIG